MVTIEAHIKFITHTFNMVLIRQYGDTRHEWHLFWIFTPKWDLRSQSDHLILLGCITFKCNIPVSLHSKVLCSFKYTLLLQHTAFLVVLLLFKYSSSLFAILSVLAKWITRRLCKFPRNDFFEQILTETPNFANSRIFKVASHTIMELICHKHVSTFFRSF